MEEVPDSYDDMSEEQKRKLFNSKLVQKGLAYQRIASGLEMLKEEDPAVYDQLISGTEQRQTRVQTTESVEDIIEAMIEEVKDHTDLMDTGDEDEDETQSDYNNKKEY